MIQIKQGTRSAQASAQLIVGSGPEADFFVGDSVMAPRHVEIRDLGGGRFECRDLGTVTGTYVDGKPVTVHALADGDEVVVGTTGLRAKIKGEGEKAQLQLTVRLNAFAYQRAKEGVFDSDPDRWVHSEQKLSRFPALGLGNRLALVVGAVGLVAVGVVTSWFEIVSDPGPLTAPHGVLFGQVEAAASSAGLAGFAASQARVDEQSCAVCHLDGGTPQSACMICHDDLSAAESRRHPFLGEDFGPLATMTENGIGDGDPEGFCVVCHTEHEPERIGAGTVHSVPVRGADGRVTTLEIPAREVLLKAGAKAWTGQCAVCHGAGVEALPVPGLPRVAKEAKSFSSIRFPHGAHVDKGIDCSICHVVDAERARLAAQGLDDPAARDFAEVPFETCAECHQNGTEARPEIAARAAEWIATDKRWDVGWHGSENGAETCARCHTPSGAGGYGPAIESVRRARGEVAGGTRALYEVERRSHDAEFAAHAEGRACVECHRDRTGGAAGATAANTTATAAFWHGLHLKPADVLRTVDESAVGKQASAACLVCHASLAGSRALVAAPDWWRAEGEDLGACAGCHFEMQGDGQRPTSMVAVSSDVAVPGAESVAQFPHEFHTQLAGGCYACHSFEAAPGEDDAFALLARTDAKAAACTNCHLGHEKIAGDACQNCHAFEPGRRDVYWIAAGLEADPRPDRPALTTRTRDWPAANGFSHLSSGHLGHACADCHLDASVQGSLAELVAPDESLQLCRKCHLEEQFHWR